MRGNDLAGICIGDEPQRSDLMPIAGAEDLHLQEKVSSAPARVTARQACQRTGAVYLIDHEFVRGQKDHVLLQRPAKGDWPVKSLEIKFIFEINFPSGLCRI